MMGHTLTQLLRDPKEIARRCEDHEGLRELSATCLLIIVVGAAVFGAVLGAHRGDTQILFSAIKLPLVILGALALAAPAFHAFAATLNKAWPMHTVVALVLAAAARSALVLMAVAPVLWLAIDAGTSYHFSILLAVFCYGLSGLAALGVLFRGLSPTGNRVLTILSFGLIFFAVGGQTAWSLRPYLGRPAQDEVPFVRAVEGTFADAIATAAMSAVGIYADDGEFDRFAVECPPHVDRSVPGSRCYRPNAGTNTRRDPFPEIQSTNPRTPGTGVFSGPRR